MDQSSERTFVEELIRGREWAKQLQNALKNSDDGSSIAFAEDLLLKISESLSTTLSALISNTNYSINNALLLTADQSDGVSAHKMLVNPIKSEESDDSFKSSVNVITSTDPGPGCYKRRRSTERPSREIETSNYAHDGYQWRKYGQKPILHTPFPKSYFRCTHREEGCEAIKYVQMIQEDPPKYRITYYGHHTCANLVPKTLEIISDLENPLSPNYSNSSNIICFANPSTSCTSSKEVQDHSHRRFVSSFDPSIKVQQSNEDQKMIMNPINNLDPIYYDDLMMSSLSHFDPIFEFESHVGNQYSCFFDEVLQQVGFEV